MTELTSKVKSVGIVGAGTVGKAIARSYLEFYDVRVHDRDEKRCTHTLTCVLESDLVFICLPTPSLADESLDTSIIEDFFGRLEYRHIDGTCFVIKSTVPIGTTKKLQTKFGVNNIVHSPEFLTARCAHLDASLPSRNIIGGHVNLSTLRLRKLYEERFPGVQTYFCCSDESEAVKLITNGFFAVKVAFFNEVHNLVEVSGMDWDQVREMILADGRIHPSHTKVPGPDGLTGFGGACLPKDAKQLGKELMNLLLDASMVHAALDRNEKDRRVS